MLDMVLLVVTLLSFLAAIAAPFIGRWDLCLWLLFLSIFSFIGMILNQPRLRELLGFLFQALSAAGDKDKTLELAGLRAPRKKMTEPKKQKMEYLTPQAKAFFALFWQIPAEIFLFLVSLPRRVVCRLRDVGLAIIAWRPKFKLPKHTERKLKVVAQVPPEVAVMRDLVSYLQVQGADTGDGSSNHLIAAISELVTRVQQPVVANQVPAGFDYKVRMVMQMLLKELGTEFGASVSTDTLLDFSVTAVQGVLPGVKLEAGRVNGLLDQVHELEDKTARLTQQSQDALQQQHEHYEERIAGLMHDNEEALRAAQEQNQALTQQVTSVAAAASLLRAKLAQAQQELVANDDQSDALILQLDDRRQELELLKHENQQAVDALRVELKQTQHGFDQAEAMIRTLNHRIDSCVDFSTPLLMFGHPAEIANVIVTNRQAAFYIITPLEERQEDEWDQWIEWLRQRQAMASADLGFLFETE